MLKKHSSLLESLGKSRDPVWEGNWDLTLKRFKDKPIKEINDFIRKTLDGFLHLPLNIDKTASQRAEILEKLFEKTNSLIWSEATSRNADPEYAELLILMAEIKRSFDEIDDEHKTKGYNFIFGGDIYQYLIKNLPSLIKNFGYYGLLNIVLYLDFCPGILFQLARKMDIHIDPSNNNIREKLIDIIREKYPVIFPILEDPEKTINFFGDVKSMRETGHSDYTNPKYPEIGEHVFYPEANYIVSFNKFAIMSSLIPSMGAEEQARLIYKHIQTTISDHPTTYPETAQIIPGKYVGNYLDNDIALEILKIMKDNGDIDF